MLLSYVFFFFFFNDTATTEIYTLSLHDALPILARQGLRILRHGGISQHHAHHLAQMRSLQRSRSEEHTSELQSQSNLVCRLLLEKKKKNHHTHSRYLLRFTFNDNRQPQRAVDMI